LAAQVVYTPCLRKLEKVKELRATPASKEKELKEQGISLFMYMRSTHDHNMIAITHIVTCRCHSVFSLVVTESRNGPTKTW